MIDHIVEFESKNTYGILVYYKNGRVRRFNKNDAMPNTVLNFYLNGTAETVYTETGKVTHIR